MNRKTFLLSSILFLLSFPLSQGWAQLSSGLFSRGLQIAFDATQQSVTGYFEDHSGFDEEMQQPKFSCIFFFHGVLKDSLILIKTYYPLEQNADTISGYIKVINENSFEMKLDEEHGGCWNVSHFSDEPSVFNLEEKTNLLQISYTIIPEVKVYSDSTKNKKLILTIDNNMVYIEDKQDGWCKIKFFGKKIVIGWIQ